MYGSGVTLAILSGIAHNVGDLLQKKAVKLIRKPLWLMGFVIHMGLGTTFFLLAQVRLGPALIPGLMAFGMIVLVIGSLWILKERLGFGEITGT